MELHKILSLMDETRADLEASGHIPRPKAKPFPGQLPDTAVSAGHLDTKKVTAQLGQPASKSVATVTRQPAPQPGSENFQPDIMPGYKPLPGPATDMEITAATGDVHPYAPQQGGAAALVPRRK